MGSLDIVVCLGRAVASYPETLKQFALQECRQDNLGRSIERRRSSDFTDERGKYHGRKELWYAVAVHGRKEVALFLCDYRTSIAPLGNTFTK